MSERPKFNDISLVCRDCGHDFVWTAGEQSFYFLKQLAEPKRCPHCRQTKKQVFATKEKEANGLHP